MVQRKARLNGLNTRWYHVLQWR